MQVSVTICVDFDADDVVCCWHREATSEFQGSWNSIASAVGCTLKMIGPPRMSEVIARIVDEAGISEEGDTLAAKMALAALTVTQAFNDVDKFCARTSPDPEVIIAKLNEIG